MPCRIAIALYRIGQARVLEGALETLADLLTSVDNEE